jgi:hypothetical protein
MIEIEKKSCNDKREAAKKENEVMKELKANMYTYKSYLTNDEINERKKDWRLNNKKKKRNTIKNITKIIKMKSTKKAKNIILIIKMKSTKK